MTERNRDRLAFAVGILAGAAIGFYLASDEGRDLRRRMQQRLGELGEEIGSMTNEQIHNLMAGVESVFAKTKTYAQDLGESIHAKTQDMKEAAQDKLADARDTFNEGVESARQYTNHKG